MSQYIRERSKMNLTNDCKEMIFGLCFSKKKNIKNLMFSFSLLFLYKTFGSKIKNSYQFYIVMN